MNGNAIIAVIAKKHSSIADQLNGHPHILTQYALPFYSEARLAQLVIYFPASFVDTYFLVHSGDIYHLLGDEMAIPSVNGKEGLLLRDRDVLGYLEFYSLACWWRNRALVFRTDDVLVDMPNIAQAPGLTGEIAAKVTQPRVVEASEDSFAVDVCAFEDSEIVGLAVDVSRSGWVALRDRKALISSPLVCVRTGSFMVYAQRLQKLAAD